MQLNIKQVAIALLGLLVLGACSSGNQASNSPDRSEPSAIASPTTPTNQTAAKIDAHGGKGGQVIESGPYYLELVTTNEANGTHLDFFLQKGNNHEPIPNAKVTAQVQLPNGRQQALNLQYDAAGKHYYAELPGTTTGEYKVVILSDIQGEKVNARYTFKR